MHPEALTWVRWSVLAFDDIRGRVLEFGGRNVNGGVRDVIPSTAWLSVDIAPGADVDVVANAATVEVEPGTWDVVVSTELLEHTPEGEAIVANAYRHLRDGGWFVATMAGPGRKPHSATGQRDVPAGEHYANVDPDELAQWLEAAGFTTYEVNVLRDDTRCIARKGEPWPTPQPQS